MRYAPLSGIAAAGLLVAGLAENNVPTSDSDATITAWLAGGHNGGWIGHGLLLGAAGIALLLFAYSLRARLTGDRPDLGASLLTMTGGLLTASVILGGALFAAVPIGHLLESSPTASAETYRLSMGLCTAVMFVFSMIPAATLAITAATIGLRRKTMPAWLAVVSYLLAALMLASALLVPFLVFGIWLLITSITLTAAKPRTPAPGRRADDHALVRV